MRTITFFLTSFALFLAVSCKTLEENRDLALEDKRLAIEALAAKYANANTAGKFNWNELSEILDNKEILARFDLSKYEDCLQNWVEFIEREQLLWLESGCQGLHAESWKILEAEEKTPGENWTRYMKFKEDNKDAFIQCESNQKELNNIRSQLLKPCIELTEIVSGGNNAFPLKNDGR